MSLTEREYWSSGLEALPPDTDIQTIKDKNYIIYAYQFTVSGTNYYCLAEDA